MTLATTENYSGGQVRDADERAVMAGATGQGKVLQFALVNTAAAGATQLVAAQAAGVKIKVVSYVLVAGAAVTVKFQSAAVDLTGAMAFAANGGVSAVGQPSAHLLETAAATALNINLGGAVQVSGHISYFVEN